MCDSQKQGWLAGASGDDGEGQTSARAETRRRPLVSSYHHHSWQWHSYQRTERLLITKATLFIGQKTRPSWRIISERECGYWSRRCIYRSHIKLETFKLRASGVIRETGILPIQRPLPPVLQLSCDFASGESLQSLFLELGCQFWDHDKVCVSLFSTTALTNDPQIILDLDFCPSLVLPSYPFIEHL